MSQLMSQVPDPISTTFNEREKSNLNSTARTLNSTPQRGGFFNEANNTNASRSLFSDAGRDVNNVFVNTSLGSKDTGPLSKLKPINKNGLHVSRCMEGTRKYIFDEIDEWLSDTNAPNILWLTGSPGAGKSAVASSMEFKLSLDRRLGASFFFKRGDAALSDPTGLWRTVSYHLARRDDAFARVVTKALNERIVDPDNPAIDSHYKFLIEEPFTETYAHSDLQTIPVIVIDALDECSDHSQWKDLLDTLAQWSRLSKTFKLIVTGRNDRMPDSFRTACKQVILPTGVDVSDQANNDIRRYFEERFAEIGGLPLAEWPGETILQKLTEQAAGLFIWAETVIKFLDQGLPNDQLELILSGTLGAGDNLTKLYKQILDMAFRNIKGQSIQTCRLVISAIVLTKIPFRVDDLHKFLSLPKQTITPVIAKLSSVISTRTTDQRIQINHLSFSEFLCDPDRCPEDFFIHRGKEGYNMTMACLKRMKEELKFNICDITTSCLLNEEVEDLSERIRMKISGSLLYSCRFWAVHLRDTTSVREDHQSLLDELRNFLYCRLLFWLEVMSLVEDVLAANTALLTVIPWIKDHDTHLSAFATDASRFIINFDIPISDSVPHIYLSALPFSPSDSLVAQHYQPQFPNTLSVVSGREKTWAALVNLFRGHKGWVISVAFSPKEKNLVVSGARDGTIRVWDVETGLLATKPFEADTGAVLSVAFSPDGKKVASGSSDQTVQIWDVKTGRSVLGPLKGHESAVSSVAFSPDGKWIASGSYDMTIRMWDVDSGLVAARSPFKGHTKGISSVAFSPNGKRVVSGSWDSTVRIWDVKTGQIVNLFDGHKRNVYCVVFSPDGTRIASSFENIIRILDAETGEQIGDPIGDVKEPINSVAFFPDGKRIVSGSADAMVRIWNVETGQVIAGPFKGHAKSIFSVTVSRDGRLVVSGSRDRTIRIWDVETDQVTGGFFGGPPDAIVSNRISSSNNLSIVGPRDVGTSQGAAVSPLLRGHTNTVTSVMFSPNGMLIASGSLDKTICIWDARKEGYAMKNRLEGHADAVNSVAFSPDNMWVASGSEDSTVRIWNLQIDPVTERIFQDQDHKGAVLSVAFSPDQKNVVSGSKDKTIRIWDVETGAVSNTLTDHTDAVVSVAYSRDGKRLVSCSWDKTIMVWDVERNPITAHSFVHTSSVISSAFSPDGNRIVSSSMDEVIRVRDLEARKVASVSFTGHTSTITCVAFSPDGKHIISGSRDQTIRVWDVETGHVAACPYKGHTNTVTSVGFSPNGGQIISGSADSTIRIWDVEIFETPPEHVETRKDRTLAIGGTRSPNEPYVSQTTGWLLGLDPDTERRRHDRLLMWIPQSSRDGLCGINTLDIFGTRPTRLDLSRFVYGKSWAECYSPTDICHYPAIQNETDLSHSRIPTIDHLAPPHASDPPKGKSDRPVFLLPNTRHLRTATYILVPLTLITVYYFHSIRHRTQL